MLCALRLRQTKVLTGDRLDGQRRQDWTGETRCGVICVLSALGNLNSVASPVRAVWHLQLFVPLGELRREARAIEIGVH